MSLINFDSKALFWILITALFAILYFRSKNFRNKFEEELDTTQIGDYVLIWKQANGEYVGDNPIKKTLKPALLLLSNISKLSELAFIISAIAALFTIFY